jgi:hypothetical protein
MLYSLPAISLSSGNYSMNEPTAPSRRKFLSKALAASAAVATPYCVSSSALGAGNSVAASDRITLGVIGIGPRCTYDMRSILKLPDVQCVAISESPGKPELTSRAGATGWSTTRTAAHPKQSARQSLLRAPRPVPRRWRCRARHESRRDARE